MKEKAVHPLPPRGVPKSVDERPPGGTHLPVSQRNDITFLVANEENVSVAFLLKAFRPCVLAATNLFN